jgi:hypothetical protein
MNRRIAGLLAALALIAAAPATQATAGSHATQVVAAKKCPSGYPHAVMPDGSHKCLHAGEFCKRKKSWQRVYHKHGFHCKKSNHRLRSY